MRDLWRKKSLPRPTAVHRKNYKVMTDYVYDSVEDKFKSIN